MKLTTRLATLQTLSLLSSIVVAVGCADLAELPAQTDHTIPAYAAGKADGALDIATGCGWTVLSTWLNDPTTDVATLKAAGLHTKAAKNVVAHRNGLDGLPGTADDNPFDDLAEVDAVKQVGPAALAQLQAAAQTLPTTACGPEPGTVPTETEDTVVFSPAPYYDSHLIAIRDLIDAAQHSVDVAIYSFKDPAIRDALGAAIDRGVAVRVLYDGARTDKKNPVGSRSMALEDLGVDVRYVNKINHHKFALIDGPRFDLSAADTAILATGSGNFSHSAATKYDENCLILHGRPAANLAYQLEFETLWNRSRDFEGPAPDAGAGLPEADLFATLETFPTGADAPLTTRFTSANFRYYVSSKYGPTFAIQSGKNHVANALVDTIEAATDRIWIASGHLRSRPVSEALIAKATSHPDVDIRVLLDGQEYVSQWKNGDQKAKLQTCLNKAGSSPSKIRKCLDKGYLWSLDVAEAGIALRYKYYAFRWDYSYAEQLHHKFLLIDDRLITGSYNLSDNAEHGSMENTVWLNGAADPDGAFGDLQMAYEAHFLALWDRGREHYAPLMDQVQNGTGPFPIVFDDMALEWAEVDALKDAIVAACPDIYTDDYRENPADHLECIR